MSVKVSFKSDKFKKNRGGYSRWLVLYCEKCKHEICVYQKDGPGILKRLYSDRIISAKQRIEKDKNLVCAKCQILLGMPIIYKKENRPAYRLFAGAVGKKIIKSDKIINR